MASLLAIGDSKGERPDSSAVEDGPDPVGRNYPLGRLSRDDPDSSIVNDAARFAVAEFNKEMNANLEFVEVMGVLSRWVAGQMFYITLRATSKFGSVKQYKATVWRGVGFNSLEEFRPAGQTFWLLPLKCPRDEFYVKARSEKPCSRPPLCPPPPSLRTNNNRAARSKGKKRKLPARAFNIPLGTASSANKTARSKGKKRKLSARAFSIPLGTASSASKTARSKGKKRKQEEVVSEQKGINKEEMAEGSQREKAKKAVEDLEV